MTNLDKLLKEFKEARSALNGKLKIDIQDGMLTSAPDSPYCYFILGDSYLNHEDVEKEKMFIDLAANKSDRIIRIIEVMAAALNEVKANGHSDLCNAMKSRRPNYRCSFEDADEALQQAEKIAGE